MVDPKAQSALARKIAAHARMVQPAPDLGALASRGFGRALRRAAQPFDGLGLRLDHAQCDVGEDLDAAIAALPAHGLISAIEGDEGARGLMGIGAGLLDALIEVQTTGRLEKDQLPPRSVTRIDEALARDFVDLVLASFAQELTDLERRDWPVRMAHGSRIPDRNRINLLLAEGTYRVFRADIGFEGVDRSSTLMLALPVDPALARSGGASHVSAGPADADWIAARARMVHGLPLALDAVLLRVTRPLAEVDRLALGDLLPFTASDLQEITLETATGHPVLRARLGQIGGRRAVRMPAANPAGQPPATPETAVAAAADPPPPATAQTVPAAALRAASTAAEPKAATG